MSGSEGRLALVEAAPEEGLGGHVAQAIARAPQRRFVAAEPGQLQREVRLDRRREVSRPFLVLWPAPVLLLQRDEPIREAALDLGLLATK